MTRYAIVADLNRCVGCQTCTAACKHANATAPGIQWRKVLDVETGEFPDVRRSFVPVGCMQCDDPPCLDVCPSTATGKRADGIVTIDYDMCIGCAYCAVACPYQARSRVDSPAAAYGNGQMRQEALREDPKRIGVAQKCTFCIDKIDAGLAAGLVPGIDPDATPACVGSCIAGALHFGDVEDHDSNVSKLLADHEHYRMHEELGTGPGIYYLWKGKAGNPESETEMQAGAELIAKPVGMAAVSPSQQKSWDWRAAANFILGGAGSGLLVISMIAGLAGFDVALPVLAALALAGLGLFCVWLEIGRPWRFINVYFHARRSWMTREAFAALPLFAFGLLSVATGLKTTLVAAAVSAALFAYCQARILQAAKGIPAWRHPRIVPLMLSTAVAEGVALFSLFAVLTSYDISALRLLALALIAAIAVRCLAWLAYRLALGAEGAPTKTLETFDSSTINLSFAQQLVPAGFAVAGLLAVQVMPVFLVLAAFAVLASGWLFKFGLIVNAGFNQGFAFERMPARGAGTSARGIKPGWSVS